VTVSSFQRSGKGDKKNKGQSVTSRNEHSTGSEGSGKLRGQKKDKKLTKGGSVNPSNLSGHTSRTNRNAERAKKTGGMKGEWGEQ